MAMGPAYQTPLKLRPPQTVFICKSWPPGIKVDREDLRLLEGWGKGRREDRTSESVHPGQVSDSEIAEDKMI